MQGPGVPRGKRVDEPVSTLDLPATLLDYAGVSPLTPIPVTADFSTGFQKLLETTASSRKLDPKLLGAWTAAVIAARRDTHDPLYPWAQAVADSSEAKAKPFSELLHAISGQIPQRDATPAPAACSPIWSVCAVCPPVAATG